MSWRSLSTAYALVRSGLHLASLLRQPLTSSAGFEEALRDRLARREANFLWSVEHLIFAHPGSPYRPLLELAGYDLHGVRQLVSARGLEGALDQLQRDGVYVRIEEFKGGVPTYRRGRTLRFEQRDFANPSAGGLLHAYSSGSRSRGTPTALSTDYLLHDARFRLWLHEQYGLADRDIVLWSTPGSGLSLLIIYAMMERPPLLWFSPVGHGGRSGPLLLAVARLAGRARLARLEVTSPDRVLDVARQISRLNTPRGIIVVSFVNSALRLMLAAEEGGIRLGDVAFMVVGEPLTPVKRRQIEGRGFKIYPRFGFSELGSVAWACPVAAEADDLHVFTDRVAIRQHTRPVDQEGRAVPAYLFTTLLSHASHVLLNVESGDYGGLEERRCGCFLERVGLGLHMHTIRSFEKLNAEGITFLGPSLITLLEEVLPRTFGGDSRHYQLVEEEDGQGLTRLYLLASPLLGPLDEGAVREVVLRELGGLHIKPEYGTRVVEQVWRDAQTVQVIRRHPLQTAGGKVLYLHRNSRAIHADSAPA